MSMLIRGESVNQEDLVWANDISFKIRFASGFFIPALIFSLNKLFNIPFPFLPVFLIGMFESFINQPYAFIRKIIKSQLLLLYINTTIDIIAITAIIHYTGSYEAPLMNMLYLLPVIFSGIHFSLSISLWLASLTSIAYAGLISLEHFQMISHITTTGLQMDGQEQVMLSFMTTGFCFLLGGFTYFSSYRLRQKSQRLVLGTRKLVESLALAVDTRDHYTRGHLQRVSNYALKIGERIGFSHAQLEELRIATLLHDIGKIGISDNILLKPTILTPEELTRMKEHPAVSETIISPLEFSKAVSEMIRSHHERFDGKGYPDGKSGSEVSIGAYIVEIADAYDAMLTDRPYRKALNKKEAIKELKNGKGTQFNPKVVEVFLNILKEE